MEEKEGCCCCCCIPNDLSTMELATELEKSTFLNLDILRTEGICPWLKSLCEDKLCQQGTLADEMRNERLRQEFDFIKNLDFCSKWRARWNFHELMTEENPPLCVIARIARLMDCFDTAFIQELQLNELKGEVVSKRKSTQQQTLELRNLQKDISNLVLTKGPLWDLVSRYKRMTQKNSHVIKHKIHKRRLQDLKRPRKSEEPESGEDFDVEMQNLLTLTKKLVLDVIRVQPGKSLHDVLNTDASPAQREAYQTLILTSPTTNVKGLKTQTQSRIITDHYISLEMKKKQIKTNLLILLNAGLIQDIMGVDAILINIAQDLRWRHKLLQQRKIEIENLKKPLVAFDAVSEDLQDQIDLYKKLRNEYVTAFFSKETAHRQGELQKGKLIHYTAEELVQRGVIVGIHVDEENLKREVLSIGPAGESVLVQLGTTFQRLTLLNLLNIENGDDPTIRVFHYDMDVGCLLFLLCCAHLEE